MTHLKENELFLKSSARLQGYLGSAADHPVTHAGTQCPSVGLQTLWLDTLTHQCGVVQLEASPLGMYTRQEVEGYFRPGAASFCAIAIVGVKNRSMLLIIGSRLTLGIYPAATALGGLRVGIIHSTARVL